MRMGSRKVMELGNLNRGLACHSDRQKVIVVNFGYFSA